MQGSEEIVPGIRFEATFGHTPGHVLVSISAGDQTVYDISGVVVHPLFLEHPEWAPAIDMDAGRADETRRRFFAQAAEENALVLPSPRHRGEDCAWPGPTPCCWSIQGTANGQASPVEDTFAALSTGVGVNYRRCHVPSASLRTCVVAEESLHSACGCVAYVVVVILQ